MLMYISEWTKHSQKLQTRSAKVHIEVLQSCKRPLLSLRKHFKLQSTFTKCSNFVQPQLKYFGDA